jgi:hypothetical protein
MFYCEFLSGFLLLSEMKDNSPHLKNVSLSVMLSFKKNGIKTAATVGEQTRSTSSGIMMGHGKEAHHNQMRHYQE